eukprot:3694901-Alexandrium_andersonii.AAC.1
MSASLVGSEMCIRDRRSSRAAAGDRATSLTSVAGRFEIASACSRRLKACLLYTSDAADDM